jgi:hypothetical protein
MFPHQITVCAPREVLWEWGGVGMNDYALLFNKTCVHPCKTIRIHNALYWRLLEDNVFRIGVGGVRMRSKIAPLSRSYFPTDFSWRADNMYDPPSELHVQSTFIF